MKISKYNCIILSKVAVLLLTNQVSLYCQSFSESTQRNFSFNFQTHHKSHTDLLKDKFLSLICRFSIAKMHHRVMAPVARQVFKSRWPIIVLESSPSGLWINLKTNSCRWENCSRWGVNRGQSGWRSGFCPSLSPLWTPVGFPDRTLACGLGYSIPTWLLVFSQQGFFSNA